MTRLLLKCDGTHAEIRFRLSAKRTSPLKLAGASVQSTTGSRGGRINGGNAGYTMFRGSVKVLSTHSIRHFPLNFPSRASPCSNTFQLDSTKGCFAGGNVGAGDGSNRFLALARLRISGCTSTSLMSSLWCELGQLLFNV